MACNTFRYILWLVTTIQRVLCFPLFDVIFVSYFTLLEMFETFKDIVSLDTPEIEWSFELLGSLLKCKELLLV